MTDTIISNITNKNQNFGRRLFVNAGLATLATVGLSSQAFAETKNNVTNVKKLHTVNLKDEDGIDRNIQTFSYEFAGGTNRAIIISSTTGLSYGFRITNYPKEVARIYAHNSLYLNGNILGFDTPIVRDDLSELTAGHSKTRKLTSTQWFLPPGSDIQKEYYSLDFIGDNMFDYVEFIDGGKLFVRAEARFNYVGLVGDWVMTTALSGSDYTKFFKHFNAWHSAAAGAMSRSKYIRPSKFIVLAGWTFGAGLAIWTGGASLAAASIATGGVLGSYATLSAVQENDAIALATATNTLLYFIKSHYSKV